MPTHVRAVEVLGRGGNGVVLEVEDLRSGARVALKTLSPSRTPDPRCLRSLWREIALFPRIQIEGVVRGLAPSVGRRGTPALVMELVEGSTLRELARAAPFGQLARSLADLASTLDRLHRTTGVVHLDVKPENVLLDGAGRTLLVDFGLAVEVGRAPEATLAGTPPYIAPERFVAHASDGSADQFSFGVMALELLSGESVDRLCELGFAGHARWVSDATRRLDPSLGAALARACSLDPADRWPSLAPLASSLCEARGAVGARPPPASARTTRLLVEPARAARSANAARAGCPSIARDSLTRTAITRVAAPGGR